MCVLGKKMEAVYKNVNNNSIQLYQNLQENDINELDDNIDEEKPYRTCSWPHN